MSMTPKRTDPDEQRFYDLLIEQELERIDLEDDELEEDLAEDGGAGDEEEAVLPEEDESLPAAMENYLKRIQQQSEMFEAELMECDQLIQHQGSNSQTGSIALVPLSEIELLQQAAAEQGLDPETYRKQILSKLDEEDDLISLDGEEEELTADSFHGNPAQTGSGEPSVLLMEVTVDSGISEGGVSDTVPSGLDGTVPQADGNLPLREEAGAIVLADPSFQFREFLRDQWHHTTDKQRQRDTLIKQKSDLERLDTEKHEDDWNSRRQKKLDELLAEEKQLAQRNATKMAELEKELGEKQKVVEQEFRQFQVSMNKLEQQTEQERIKLEQQREREGEKQARQAEGAAITIQAAYKGYRVRKIYGDDIRQKQQAVKEEMELNKIKQKEAELKKLEEARKEQEERRKREKEEQEKKDKEEQERKEKEESLRKDKEEQEKMQKAEQEKKEKEEQEQKDREERLKKEKEQQERKVKEEQEQKEREERLKKEKEEHERKEKEERDRKEEQERKEKEKLRKEKEEEERKIREEKLRKEREEKEREAKEEQERKAKEEEQKERERLENEDRISKENKLREKEEQERKVIQEQLRKEKEDLEIKTKEEQQRTEKMQPNEDCVPHTEQGKDPLGILMGSLAEDLERRRRNWMKECVSWSKISNEPWKIRQKSSKKLVKRPSSSKKLPSLEEDIILKQARVSSLQQVTTVQLSDLPGCSLTTLGQCVKLQYLELTGCGLRAVDGLSSCKHLQYINLQNNQIQYIDFCDLDKLEYVDLSSNQLTVIHGLDGCSNLRYLDLSKNKIIKLGSLSGLRRLHTLKLCQNQLISTQGLGEVPTVQSLHLSYNHLQSVEDIDKLCLLQTLALTGNNILQMPVLQNHVLLQELKLDDNSITSLDNILSSWLPCLRQLNVAQNSISELGVVSTCFILKDLDLSNNQLLDGDEILKSLAGCRHLDNLCIEGNPGGEEPSFMSKAAVRLPRLSLVDGKSVQRPHPHLPVAPECSFEATCLAQTQAVQQIWTKYHQSIKSANTSDLTSLCCAVSTMCQTSFDMAVEHRYAHEYGEVIVNWPAAPTEPKPTGRTPSRGRCRVGEVNKAQKSCNTTFEKDQTPDTEAQVDTAIVEKDKRDATCTDSLVHEAAISKQIEGQAKVTEYRHSHTGTPSESNSDKCDGGRETDFGVNEAGANRFDGSDVNVSAATASAWETNSNCRSNSGLLSEVSLLVQRSDVTLAESEDTKRQWTYRDDAATIIQAAWRGYSLRNRLLMALEYARFEDDEDEEFAEVDLGDFNFDMADLDDDWKPPPTPKIPHSHALLGKPPSGRPAVDTNPVSELTSPHPPAFPKQAWRNLTSPLTNRALPKGHALRPPSSQASGTDTHRTGMSKKEEMLSEEWGFKDSKTAELMMQRAKKMKYNSDKKRKLSKLDPKQKLALFKKLTESTRMLMPVQHPTRKVLPRKEYFQARAREAEQKQTEKRSEVATRASRTYEWLHTQVGEFPTSDPAKVLTRSESETGLPRLDDDITAGRRVQLVASPVAMDLESVSSLGENRQRSLSMDGPSPLGVQQVPLQFPPIKTTSAPSSRTKERMSWRTKKKTSDVGWGGGRKRTVHS